MNYLRRWWERYGNPTTVVADTSLANVFLRPEETSTTSFRIHSELIGEWDPDENIVSYDETPPVMSPSDF